MGKDQSGGFHPPKGKPSGSKKSEGLGVSTTPPDQLEDFLDRDDEYTLDDERIDPSIQVNNPNRPKTKNTTLPLEAVSPFMSRFMARLSGLSTRL